MAELSNSVQCPEESGHTWKDNKEEETTAQSETHTQISAPIVPILQVKEDTFETFKKHRESFQILKTLENYLDYKIARALLAKRALTEVISDYQTIKEPKLKGKELRLLAFLLRTADYLNTI